MKTNTYIAFLRGINIGGQRVKMERLRELFSGLGLTGVRSYIQTGNIFFESADASRDALTQRIERHLAAALGYEVPTFLRTIAEVERALRLDPFKRLEPTPDTRFLITFISRPLPDDLKLPLVSPKADYEILRATPGEVFSLMRLVNGRPGNPATLIEKICKAKTTSRFFATTVKILEAAKSASVK
ncbi:MAG: hypothetical protein QOG71_889 [Pyrinomonadaceae bacterium]|nr:hypothetical protein [Pyrinomonadaceae bacterium]